MARGCVWLWLGWAGFGYRARQSNDMGINREELTKTTSRKKIDIRGFESSRLIPRLIAANN